MTWTPSRVVVTGGAGFLGSHLADRLLAEGADVVCVDNMITGSPRNVDHLQDNPHFTLCIDDVTSAWSVDGPVDAVLHFASLASPVDYQNHPLATLEVGTLGTMNALRLADDKRASCLRRRARCTATLTSIRSPRPTGGTSTQSGREACTTSPSGFPRQSPRPI
jgi:nucleoside-diphosphate-sugar epimerase